MGAVCYDSTATVWRITGNDGFGNRSWSIVGTFSARFRPVNEIIKSIDGNDVRVSTLVYVNGDLQKGDYVLEGSSVANPPDSAALEARQVVSNPMWPNEVKAWL